MLIAKFIEADAKSNDLNPDADVKNFDEAKAKKKGGADDESVKEEIKFEGYIHKLSDANEKSAWRVISRACDAALA